MVKAEKVAKHLLPLIISALAVLSMLIFAKNDDHTKEELKYHTTYTVEYLLTDDSQQKEKLNSWSKQNPKIIQHIMSILAEQEPIAIVNKYGSEEQKTEFYQKIINACNGQTFCIKSHLTE